MLANSFVNYQIKRRNFEKCENCNKFTCEILVNNNISYCQYDNRYQTEFKQQFNISF